MTNVLLLEPDTAVQEHYLVEFVAHYKFALERASCHTLHPVN